MRLYGVGHYMVIMLAGLQSIPDDLHEAAKVDGASGLALFRHITLPLSVAYHFLPDDRGHDRFAAGVHRGLHADPGGDRRGPRSSTCSTSISSPFTERRFGYASVLAWLLFLIIMGLTLLQFWLARRWVHYESQEA